MMLSRRMRKTMYTSSLNGPDRSTTMGSTMISKHTTSSILLRNERHFCSRLELLRKLHRLSLHHQAKQSTYVWQRRHQFRIQTRRSGIRPSTHSQRPQRQSGENQKSSSRPRARPTIHQSLRDLDNHHRSHHGRSESQT